MIQRVGRCLAAAILAISAGVGSAADDPTSAAGRVNVLLVCVDDLKPAIGCYGDALAKTPNIDRLAARGVRFERAYCNQAVCSPSRNALLTGFRPQSLGIYDLATNFRRAVPTVRTLPQLFRDGGFHASALGKIFHVGHGNHDDEASWDEPLFRGKTVQYQLPANRGPSREEGGDHRITQSVGRPGVRPRLARPGGRLGGRRARPGTPGSPFKFKLSSSLMTASLSAAGPWRA